MPATKRKLLETRLQRRVRARRNSSEEFEEAPYEPKSPTRNLNEGVNSLDGDGQDMSESDDENTTENQAELDHSSESESESEPEATTSISFGALLKAQATLQQPPKHTEKSKPEREGKNQPTAAETWQDSEALERQAGRKDHRDFSRPSKHAPAELSSKKAVSRKREVVAVTKREHRDPRFESLSGPLDETKVQKAYSFLDDYREDEMKELKSTIKKTREEAEKERLKRALLSMESRKKAQERKRKEVELLDRHRKEEKELVRQGKKPFYLKKTEQRERLLVDRFSELKGKQLDHVLERRRKKVEGKEKKSMPWSRREGQEAPE